MSDKWDRRFLDLAESVAGWSKDPSSQVGAVIVRPDKTISSLGFNGFPRGMSDAPELYAEREIKYARVVHAEMNAILSAHEPVKGFTLYTTLPPCDRCCVHLIQSGLSRVVWPDEIPEDFADRWRETIARSVAMFQEAGVQVGGWGSW